MEGMHGIRLLLAALLMLGLAACGGSSGGGSAAVPEGPTPAEQELAAAKAAAEKARKEKEAAEVKLQALLDQEALKKEQAAAKDARMLFQGLSGDALTFGTDEPEVTDKTVTATIGDAATALRKPKALAQLKGWSGAEYMKTAGGSTDIVTVYTNREAPKAVPFADVHDTIAVTDNTVANGALTTTAGVALVMSPSFGAPSGASVFTLPKSSTLETTERTFSGTLGGAPGTYTCVGPQGTTCTATVSGKGFTLDGSDGATAWTFKFSQTKPMAMMIDAEYQAFGWWLRKGADAFEVATFIDDVAPTAITGLSALQGTATYQGGAAGKYGLYSVGKIEGGHFTANAMLKADFRDGTEGGMISGTLDGFMTGDMSRDWTVALKDAAIGTDGVIAAADTIWSIGGTAEKASNDAWSGQLHEVIPADMSGAGTPRVATGVFSAEYGVLGHMAGAFGAEKQ